ncbi:MAG: TonB-dependent receptor [Deltaproteobacteria bacterium]|nr:TonB-dependent receptor [Deltaproteobacteria bacterium]
MAGSRSRAALAAVVAALALHTSVAHAQQRGTDVGGQPARRQLTKMPKLVKFVEADYPPERKQAGIEAAVVLTIEIAATGEVANVAVAQSAGADFDAAAIAAAKQLVFEPAEVDHKPAPAKITFRYQFVIKEEPPLPAMPAPEATPEAPPAPPEAAQPPRPDPSTPSKPEPPVTEDVEVRGRPRERKEAFQTTIRAEQARKVAGTQGDVLKVVQNLPGVSRPPVASGQLVVWGAAPRETKILVDGVEIPALYHGSGLRSVVSSDLVAAIDLVPGAFGAEYGRGLGGLVRVETRALPRGTHGYLGVDTLDGSGLLSTEIGPRARIAIAGRQSWLDRVLTLVSAPDVGDFFPIPRYRDGQIKATVDLRRGEGVDLVVLGATDDLTRTVPSPDPASTRSETTFNGFWRAYARYTRQSEGSTAIVTPFFGRDTSELTQRFGAAPARLDVDTHRYGARASLRTRVSSHVALHTGVDVLGSSSNVRREGSLSLPPREGDIAVFGQPPGDDVAVDDFQANVVDIAPSVHADLRVGPVVLTPGARFDAYLVEGSRKTPRIGLTPSIGFSRLETALAPRASARWEVMPGYALTAAYGQYHQAPEPEELSAVFGTPDLALQRSTHVTFGQSLKITSSLSAEVVGFRKTMKDLVVRSRLTNPLLARSLTQNGEGRSYGVQFLLRQEMWSGFFGWVSYAISRSERRVEGEEDYRKFDFDQPHVLSVVASQEVGRWTFGARFRYASGNPRTPVVASTYDAQRDRYDPVFGPQGSIRIPAFWQLDLRIERVFPLGDQLRLLLFADVQNVTNRENAEEIVYSPSFRQRKTITGLPTIAVIGARLEL